MTETCHPRPTGRAIWLEKAVITKQMRGPPPVLGRRTMHTQSEQKTTASVIDKTYADVEELHVLPLNRRGGMFIVKLTVACNMEPCLKGTVLMN